MVHCIITKALAQSNLYKVLGVVEDLMHSHQSDVLFEEYINDLLVVNSKNSLPFDYKSSS